MHLADAKGGSIHMATEKQNADELKARIAELPSGYMASVRCFFYSVII